MIANMKATLLVKDRVIIAENAFAEIKLWKVPARVRDSEHHYKYSLAFVVDGVCVLRYDNEAGKGDHRHWGGQEGDYLFRSPGQLVEDFISDIRRWQDENS